MKKLSAVILLLVICITGCKKAPFSNEYEQSYTAWQNFKSVSNNSYVYRVSFQSWSGFRTETQITVKNGEVIERTYKMFQRENDESNNSVEHLKKSWVEQKAELNTHPYEGAEVLTMDQVYNKAKNEWLKADQNKNKIYFEAKNDGMISSCGYVPNGCMDDCFNGIRISSIASFK